MPRVAQSKRTCSLDGVASRVAAVDGILKAADGIQGALPTRACGIGSIGVSCKRKVVSLRGGARPSHKGCRGDAVRAKHANLQMGFPLPSLCCSDRRGAVDDCVRMAATAEGSASFMASVGSALECRRFRSFSSGVSWVSDVLDRCEWLLNVLGLERALPVCWV